MFSNNEKVRLRDCPQGQLLLPRQCSAHCLSDIQQQTDYDMMTASAESSQCYRTRKHPVWFQIIFPDDESTTMMFTITTSTRHLLTQPFFLFVYTKHGSILWKSARFLWDKCAFLVGKCSFLVGRCAFLVGEMRVSCNIPRGKTHSVAVFLGCA